MRIYNLLLDRLIKQNLPSLLRYDPWLYAVLWSCLLPLKTLYERFKVFKAEVDYRLKYNSQVCYLQGMLNDGFDPDQRRIRIENEPLRAYWMVKRNVEQEPEMVNNNAAKDFKVVYRGDVVRYPHSFVVNVPLELSAEANKIIASIGVFALVTREYRINYTI